MPDMLPPRLVLPLLGAADLLFRAQLLLPAADAVSIDTISSIAISSIAGAPDLNVRCSWSGQALQHVQQQQAIMKVYSKQYSLKNHGVPGVVMLSEPCASISSGRTQGCRGDAAGGCGGL